MTISDIIKMYEIDINFVIHNHVHSMTLISSATKKLFVYQRK